MSLLRADVRLHQGNFELNVELQLAEGEITALLGPSGSGKTTVLRVLAGLERPTAGHIVCGDEVWFDGKTRVCWNPQRRRCGFVFQDYALFDHLDVTANIAYGVPRELRQSQARHWMEKLHLSHVAAHYPAQLSGGQRQRTALGRALAIDPRLLLLDEPFSAVDFALRHRLRVELRELVERVGYPIALVSHDLDEVRQLARRVYVLDEGAILQHGDCADVFENPLSRRVARIVGWKNILPVRWIRNGVAQGTWGELALNVSDGRDGWLGVKPETISVVAAELGALTATVRHVTELGAFREVTCVTADESHVYVQQPWRSLAPRPGDHVGLAVAREAIRYWPEETHFTFAETHTV